MSWGQKARLSSLAISDWQRPSLVAVGTPVSRRPRTDPYVKDYIIRLLPRVCHMGTCHVEAFVGIGTQGREKGDSHQIQIKWAGAARQISTNLPIFGGCHLYVLLDHDSSR